MVKKSRTLKVKIIVMDEDTGEAFYDIAYVSKMPDTDVYMSAIYTGLSVVLNTPVIESRLSDKDEQDLARAEAMLEHDRIRLRTQPPNQFQRTATSPSPEKPLFSDLEWRLICASFFILVLAYLVWKC